MNWIKELISKLSCHHEWRLDKEIRVCDDFGGSYWKFLYICKKCGKITWIKSN